MLVTNAFIFASKAHEGQMRKYTGEPYMIHPMQVAKLVEQVVGDEEKEMIAAALLHDVVEDTDTTIEQIEELFGERVASLVSDLTDISKPEDGNRAVRKMIDRQHSASASPSAKTIKLADLINNSDSILKYDHNFSKVYMKEKRELVKVLKEGDPLLFAMATDILNNYFEDK
jgi:(p)ppGpp synthase/HD superfamily hydrolase